MILNLIGNVNADIKFAPSGYHTHAQEFFNALARVNEGESKFVSAYYDGKALHQFRGLEQADFSICIGLPFHLNSILQAYNGKKIGYTVFETTKIPDFSIEEMKDLDQLWVPSSWGRNILLNHGFFPRYVKVVPEGFNPEIFNLNVPPRNSLKRNSDFKFLFIGRDDDRKNIPELIRAFKREFIKEPVSLFLSSYIPFRYELPSKVYAINTIGNPKIFARIYRACDAYVSASRTEGWGLPLLEAMACGLPVITCNFGGMSEFISEENAYLVDYSLQQWDNYGVWAQPDEGHLRHQMRCVYENYSEAKDRAMTVCKAIKKWTWKNSAKIAYQEINRMA